MDKRRKKIIGALAVVLIAVLIWSFIFSIPVVFATDPPSPYVIEEEGWKDVYSLSPDSSSVIRKTIWRVRRGKLSDPIFIEAEEKYKCFKEAAKKIMEIEGVYKVEGERKDQKYHLYPVREE